MLNLKKLIASIAAITVALSTVSFAATYTDVAEDSAYYEAVESLSKLGIVTGDPDGTYRPEDTVTRAEMAALIARIQGYDETAKGSANTVFTDVPASHWASGYIAQANNQGIVNGYGDGTFGPEDTVLYEQAVKMIMATLGYTPFAENNGSYPTGYLTAASRYGVVDGVSNAVIGTGANRGTVAQLLANAIDTPLMGQSKWATDGTVEYTIYDGTTAGIPYKTLMSENLGIVKLKGIVVENTVTNIKTSSKTIDTTKAAMVDVDITDNFDSNEKDFKDNVSNNDTLDINHNGNFLVGETDIEDYLGMSVVFYVDYNDVEDMWEVISVAADSTKNEMVSFTLDQFNTIVTDISGATYVEYFKEVTDRDPVKVAVDNRTVNSEAQLNTVYNGVGGQTLKGNVLDDGVYATPYVAGGTQCQYGGLVTLINNDIDPAYDVAFVELAVTAVVDAVADDSIAFKSTVTLPGTNYYGLGELLIDEDATNKVISIVKDGEAVDYTTLTEWDVLSIIAAEASDPKYIYAEVIGTPVVGTIDASFTSNTSYNSIGYTVAGTKYDVAADAYGADDLEVGTGGTIYIDKYGKIAAFNEDLAVATGVAGNYGFVTKAIVDNDAINGKTVTVQMLTANGIETFDLATSVSYKYVGGEATKKPADAAVKYDSDGDTVLDTNYTDKEVMADVFFTGATVAGTSDHDSDASTPEVEYTDGTAIGQFKGQVIQYTTNSNGKINSITLADHNDEKFDVKSVSAASYAFDADNMSFATSPVATYVDADATVFFVTPSGSDYDTDKCLVGTAADLEDKVTYPVVAVYADNKAEDNNIIVVQAVNTSSPTTGVAVITGVAESQVDGDEIYVLEYNMGGDVLSAETVAKVELGDYTSTAPTIGDVVKVKLNGEGKISGLSKVWDFAENVRTGAETVAVTQGTPALGGLEAYDGGYVTAYQKSSQQATLSTGNTYKLSQAENVYVVENTGRGVEVNKGTSASWRYYENLYDTTKVAMLRVDGVAQTGYSNIVVGATSVPPASATTWENALDKYTDHVFVRTYEGKVKDLVIVKGMRKVSVAALEKVTVTFDTTGFTAGGAAVPATAVYGKGNAVTLPAVTGYVLTADGTTAAVGWSTAADGSAPVTELTATSNVTLYMY